MFGIRTHAVHFREDLHDSELVFQQLPEHRLFGCDFKTANQTPGIRLPEPKPKLLLHFLAQRHRRSFLTGTKIIRNSVEYPLILLDE